MTEQFGPSFNCLWQTDKIRETLFDLLSKEDICNVRRTSSACCNLVTKRLFKRTHLTFTATSFTRQSRVQALARIGHHIEHLTFHFPHSEATFLPPLIHPDSGREISFLYKPHTSIASVLERPKFANSGLGQILTEQYPPLFHAASNVPAFIHAIKHLVNLRHLTIRTPGQDAKERYRRDIVDYALISLRISLERAPIERLSKLSLVSVHPAAFMYLSHVPGGFGSLPSASRRWRQIRRMTISAEAWDFYSASPGLDHLKMMEDFIRSFSSSLEKLTFTWLGRKGPCPLSLATDPLFAPPRCTQKLFHEVTSPMSPLPPAPARKPVVLPKARYLAVRNATMNERQVADLVSSHQYNVREFDFENVVLINAGSWDAALAPLLEHPCTKDNWSRYSSATIGETLETIQSVRGKSCPSSPADLSGHSAAVAALSRELLDMRFGLDDGELDDDQQTIAPELDSDLEAARQASIMCPSQLKKRRVTRHRRRRKDTHERATEDEAEAGKDFMQHDHFRPETPTTPTAPTMSISSPILNTQPSMPILLQPAVYDPTAELCSEISAVQRDLAAEETHRAYAEDVDMQSSALRKAKELVLSRLGSHFGTLHSQRDSRKDSIGSSGFLSSARFREGLFRRGSPIPQGLRHFSGHSHFEHRSMEVPILFSRA
ncbi:hypothetical protein Micbo1qcDRAFT_183776 [Microdochium bolleyi]|uniref:F-box domain-containing protein n=1 Tax=Microdochium bolleyi TaxID=196109 RepID=A0A136J0W4_9PEZI|nr:hypothetical protein Micbo1qcDRAFT_183776 [Microdochium bolleyi]